MQAENQSRYVGVGAPEGTRGRVAPVLWHCQASLQGHALPALSKGRDALVLKQGGITGEPRSTCECGDSHGLVHTERQRWREAESVV